MSRTALQRPRGFLGWSGQRVSGTRGQFIEHMHYLRSLGYACMYIAPYDDTHQYPSNTVFIAGHERTPEGLVEDLDLAAWSAVARVKFPSSAGIKITWGCEVAGWVEGEPIDVELIERETLEGGWL